MLIAPDLILLAGLLLAMSILATVITPRLGVPLLLVFLVIGMLAGVDGPGGIPSVITALPIWPACWGWR